MERVACVGYTTYGSGTWRPPRAALCTYNISTCADMTSITKQGQRVNRATEYMHVRRIYIKPWSIPTSKSTRKTVKPTSHWYRDSRHENNSPTFGYSSFLRLNRSCTSPARGPDICTLGCPNLTLLPLLILLSSVSPLHV